MTKISLLKIIRSTTVDGPGLRTSIYCAGCTHHCKGCHNPQSWDIHGGTPTDIEEIFEQIVADDFNNVTFSGGDPMMQAPAFTKLAQIIKERTDKNIWCYTGYTFEEVIANRTMQRLLMHIDVLVDGRFDESKKDEDLLFRGSSNQRLIDVRQSLLQDRVVEFDYNPFPGFDDVCKRQHTAAYN